MTQGKSQTLTKALSTASLLRTPYTKPPWKENNAKKNGANKNNENNYISNYNNKMMIMVILKTIVMTISSICRHYKNCFKVVKEIGWGASVHS